jgi:hypothetical protein
MILGIDDIVPEALHRKVGWDIRHHFMAEKIIDRFGLVLPRDRELVRQLAVVYVMGGHKAPPNGIGLKRLRRRERPVGVRAESVTSMPHLFLSDINAMYHVVEGQNRRSRRQTD